MVQGQLPDGTVIAVKKLSSKSTQGDHEFVNEIGMISALQHPNLVKLYGCCVEGNQLLLVYEYMENNSLARALYGNGGHLCVQNITILLISCFNSVIHYLYDEGFILSLLLLAFISVGPQYIFLNQ